MVCFSRSPIGKGGFREALASDAARWTVFSAADRDRSCRSCQELGRSRFGLGRLPTGGFPARGCVWVPQHPSGRSLGPDAGEIGHGGRQQELGFGFEASPIARLAQAQLHQRRQAMFGHLAPSPLGCKGRAGLQGPGLMQQPFLGMQADTAPAPGCGLHALRSQGTAVTDRAPASRAMWKACLVKYRLRGGLGTLATRVRSTLANCRRVSPSP